MKQTVKQTMKQTGTTIIPLTTMTVLKPIRRVKTLTMMLLGRTRKMLAHGC